MPARLLCATCQPFPGQLPEGITKKSLAKGRISVLRNPDIAHLLCFLGLTDKAGRGSVPMIRQCRENGLPGTVRQSSRALGVTVTFHAPEVTGEVMHLFRTEKPAIKPTAHRTPLSLSSLAT